MTDIKFDFLASRLYLLEISTDHSKNIELWHYLSVFESHVYGAILQLSRITDDLTLNERSVAGSSAGLDIYFYNLVWDKLKKILDKINNLANKIAKSADVSESFGSAYRSWRKRIEHLFSEFDSDIRNEYEHPSLEFYSVGNIKMWGNIQIDSSGNIKAHVGSDSFSLIKKEHCSRLLSLRTELFDLFIRHFSQKRLSQELIELRCFIEGNIDAVCNELMVLKEDSNWDDFNEGFNKLIMMDAYLSKEQMPLPRDVKDKIYSIALGAE